MFFITKKIKAHKLLIFAMVFALSCLEKNEQQVYRLKKDELALLQPGDIILRKGTGSLSQAIDNYLDPWLSVSHIGILSRNADGSWVVIHSISKHLSEADGLQQVDLHRFVSESVLHTVKVTRLKNTTMYGNLGSLIEQQALYYLAQGIGFDYSFSLEDTTRMFCSEFVWLVIRNTAGLDIFADVNTSSLSQRLGFTHFVHPNYFDVIIDHHRQGF